MIRISKKQFKTLRLSSGVFMACGFGFLLYTGVLFMVGLKTKVNKTTSQAVFQASKGVNLYLTAFCSGSATGFYNTGSTVLNEEERSWIVDETESIAKLKHDWYLLHDPSFNTNSHTTSKYQQYFYDLDLRSVLPVHSFVVNKIHASVLPRIAQAFNIPESLLQINDISILKMNNGIGTTLKSYLHSGDFGAVIPLKQFAVNAYHGVGEDESDSSSPSIEDGLVFTPQALDDVQHDRLFRDTEYMLVVELSFVYFNACQRYRAGLLAADL